MLGRAEVLKAVNDGAEFTRGAVPLWAGRAAMAGSFSVSAARNATATFLRNIQRIPEKVVEHENKTRIAPAIAMLQDMIDTKLSGTNWRIHDFTGTDAKGSYEATCYGENDPPGPLNAISIARIFRETEKHTPTGGVTTSTSASCTIYYGLNPRYSVRETVVDQVTERVFWPGNHVSGLTADQAAQGIAEITECLKNAVVEEY